MELLSDRLKHGSYRLIPVLLRLILALGRLSFGCYRPMLGCFGLLIGILVATVAKVSKVVYRLYEELGAGSLLTCFVRVWGASCWGS